ASVRREGGCPVAQAHAPLDRLGRFHGLRRRGATQGVESQNLEQLCPPWRRNGSMDERCAWANGAASGGSASTVLEPGRGGGRGSVGGPRAPGRLSSPIGERFRVDGRRFRSQHGP